ncbi:hypothetical protein [Cronobacter dublinensis]|uniref:hypothetical protein n=1 Tax=Cronobacter dublinensis TaxID=413497 RepID=UPI00300E1F37
MAMVNKRRVLWQFRHIYGFATLQACYSPAQQIIDPEEQIDTLFDLFFMSSGTILTLLLSGLIIRTTERILRRRREAGIKHNGDTS